METNSELIERLVTRIENLSNKLGALEERESALMDKLAKAPISRIDETELANQLSLVGKGGKISAIKVFRMATGKGLKESKDAIERYWPRV